MRMIPQESRTAQTMLATTNDFFAALQRSGLLETALVEELRRRFAADPAASDPAKIAQTLVTERLLTPFQAKRLLDARYRGFFVAGKYKILDLLGDGGMGRVLLCEHLLMRRLVAVKILHATFAKNNEAVDRFLREARASASLNHPNIAQVFDVDRSERGPYLVMEYIDGADLHRLTVKHGPLDPSRAAHYIRQAAAGLQHAHEAGLVHRDVKPVNLMLDRSGTVKLLDLGLARFFDADKNEHLTQQYNASAVLGTADFIAPEQALDSAKVDIRADVYSLGMTMYFLLTRKIPFGSGKTLQKLLWHQVREPEPLREIRPEISTELADVVGRMIRKAPAERYQTPDEVMAALAPFAREAVSPPADVEMPAVRASSFRLGVLVGKPRVDEPAVGAASGEHILREESRHAPHADGPTAKPSKPRLAPVADPSAETKAVAGSSSSLSPTPPSRTNHPRSPAPATAPAETAASVAAQPSSPPIGPGRRFPPRTRWMLAAQAAAVLLIAGAAFVWFRSGGQAANSTGGPRNAGAPAVPPTGIVLHGGGSTFVRPMLDHWAQIYQDQTGINIQYASVGSTKGIEGLRSKLLDFGCSDAFLTDAQLSEAGGQVVHVPLVLGAVVPTYNLPLDETGHKALRFTGPVLANIYLGRITRWDDPAIAVNNPGVDLPDLAITPVHRRDGSGTTSIWTDYLSKASGAWKEQVGVGTMVEWPVGVGADKNDGVADTVSRTHGAIGYVELSFALANGLPAGEVKNAAGHFVAPSIAGVTAAAAGALKTIPADLRFSLTDAPGNASFPICGTTWAVIYVDQPPGKGEELAKFLRWATTDGQQYAGDLRYGRLPDEMAPAVLQAIDLIHGAK